MKAVEIEAFGGIGRLRIRDAPAPRPGRGQVLVRIQACGLNYADILQREGLYPGGPVPPFRPGCEASGSISALGSQVVGFQKGARVAAIASGGLFAEYAAVDASACLTLPEFVSFEEGAAFPIAYLSAYHVLKTLTRARKGETVLIHAAAGAVASATLQIAKLLGMQVIATASTTRKRQIIRALGADAVTGYDDFPSVCRRLTRGRGPDIVVDTVGGDVFPRSLALLAPLGRLAVVGMASRQAASVGTSQLLFRSRSVMGLHLSAILERPQLLGNSLAALLDWIRRGELKVRIGHRMPLAQIARAQGMLAGRQSIGKIILIP